MSRSATDLDDDRAPLTEILEVRRHQPADGRVLAFNLDQPVALHKLDVWSFAVSGWVLGAEQPVRQVHLRSPQGRTSHTLALDKPRPDAVRIHPGSANDETCGFEEHIGVIGMPPECELDVVAELEGGRQVPLARLRFRHRPLRTGFEATLQPLMVNALGRSGSTWIMRLLAEHPRVVAHRDYPYETRLGAWWLHALKVLTEPTNLERSNGPHDFHDSVRWIGNNPFYRRPLLDHAGLKRWVGRSFPEGLGAFLQLCCEGFYSEVAAAQGQRDCAYFAEKHLARSHLSWLAWELYPGAKELVLVRDFRDNVASILAFNAKRGFNSFGRDKAGSDEEYLRGYRESARMLLDDWRSRAAVAHLVRYEDLILDPVPTLRGILQYLELDASAAVVDGMRERAARDTELLKQHRTTRRPEDSIGRWKRDLPPNLVELCQDTFGDILGEFGYPADGDAPAAATGR